MLAEWYKALDEVVSPMPATVLGKTVRINLCPGMSSSLKTAAVSYFGWDVRAIAAILGGFTGQCNRCICEPAATQRDSIVRLQANPAHTWTA